MNIPQEIINLILKSMFYEDFKSSFTKDERDFIDRIRTSSLKHFKISSIDGRTIITWDSDSTVKQVACYVSDRGFHFSEIEEYNPSTKNMKGLASESLSPDNIKILDTEIEEIKNIFCGYSQDVEVYFK